VVSQYKFIFSPRRGLFVFVKDTGIFRADKLDSNINKTFAGFI
jgi:hypothetical protein